MYWLIEDFLYFYSVAGRWKLALLSIILAISFLFLLKYKKSSVRQKLYAVYAHLFFLLSPFVFFAFFRTCQAFFTSCYVPRNVLYISFLGGITAGIAGILITPMLFYYHYRKKSILIEKGSMKRLVDSYAKKLGLKKTKLFILDAAKPIAFSFNYIKSRIFISLGMMELLSKKEAEAVDFQIQLKEVKYFSDSAKEIAALLHEIKTPE